VTYLLDTNVVSELRKARPDASVMAWFAGVDSSDLYVSVLVVGEIRRGVEGLRRRGDGSQAGVYDTWLAALKREFADRLLPISTSIAERWGALNAARTLSTIDGLLAATALEHDLTLVTRDVGAVEGTGARVLDPWAATDATT
jgi:predicted nucleic acid-binding protein